MDAPQEVDIFGRVQRRDRAKARIGRGGEAGAGRPGRRQQDVDAPRHFGVGQHRAIGHEMARIVAALPVV
jgi:hypothetical protein